ncbi:MAG: PadR family transcriptional regulator [Chloroflexi bacterium RBG_13_66_10]|nr:MAG: PadR family transcriptional regulator [Chloroflexi bacterium RBG_13_66_10]
MSVRNALLGLLLQSPRHGYELRTAFEAVMGGEANWGIKPAQVYTTLSRLEESGLVEVEGVQKRAGPEKRIYAVTPAGREAFRSWLASPVRAGHQRDEFFLKLMLTLATGEAEPQKVIYTQRAGLYQELHDLTEQRDQADPKRELAQILLLDQAIMHLEADLRWLEVIEARLNEVARQPIPEPEARPRGRPPKVR